MSRPVGVYVGQLVGTVSRVDTPVSIGGGEVIASVSELSLMPQALIAIIRIGLIFIRLGLRYASEGSLPRFVLHEATLNVR
jgi:hypothetical protein